MVNELIIAQVTHPLLRLRILRYHIHHLLLANFVIVIIFVVILLLDQQLVITVSELVQQLQCCQYLDQHLLHHLELQRFLVLTYLLELEVEKEALVLPSFKEEDDLLSIIGY